MKKAREALASKDPARAQEALRAATRTLDKAASKGVLHKKNASRRIARLAAAAQATQRLSGRTLPYPVESRAMASVAIAFASRRSAACRFASVVMTSARSAGR